MTIQIYYQTSNSHTWKSDLDSKGIETKTYIGSTILEALHEFEEEIKKLQMVEDYVTVSIKSILIVINPENADNLDTPRKGEKIKSSSGHGDQHVS